MAVAVVALATTMVKAGGNVEKGAAKPADPPRWRPLLWMSLNLQSRPLYESLHPPHPLYCARRRGQEPSHHSASPYPQQFSPPPRQPRRRRRHPRPCQLDRHWQRPLSPSNADADAPQPPLRRRSSSPSPPDHPARFPVIRGRWRRGPPHWLLRAGVSDNIEADGASDRDIDGGDDGCDDCDGSDRPTDDEAWDKNDEDDYVLNESDGQGSGGEFVEGAKRDAAGQQRRKGPRSYQHDGEELRIPDIKAKDLTGDVDEKAERDGNDGECDGDVVPVKSDQGAVRDPDKLEQDQNAQYQISPEEEEALIREIQATMRKQDMRVHGVPGDADGDGPTSRNDLEERQRRQRLEREEDGYKPITVRANSSRSGVQFDRNGPLGYIILDRPSKLNAASKEMITRILEKLSAWYRDDNIKAVVIKSSSMGRSFCSGGDVIALAQMIESDPNTRTPKETLICEYQAVLTLKNYPKPTVCLMDGITMGFGAGLAAAASVRIATENTLFAMPEAKIGFFPDAGYIWHAVRSQAGAAIGSLLGLSGMAVGRDGMRGGSDLIALGVATHYTQSGKIEELEREIYLSILDAPNVYGSNEGKEMLRAAKRVCEKNLPPSPLLSHRDVVDELLAGCNTAHECVARITSYLQERQHNTSQSGGGDKDAPVNSFLKSVIDNAKMGSPYAQEAWWAHYRSIYLNYVKYSEETKNSHRKSNTLIYPTAIDDPNYKESFNDDRLVQNSLAKLPLMEAVLAREYALGSELIYRNDFRLGVNAVLVEKRKDGIPPGFSPNEGEIAENPKLVQEAKLLASGKQRKMMEDIWNRLKHLRL